MPALITAPGSTKRAALSGGMRADQNHGDRHKTDQSYPRQSGGYRPRADRCLSFHRPCLQSGPARAAACKEMLVSLTMLR